jgi:hypothetical protein
MIKLERGDILLTAGVGGTSANWRDRWLSNAIIRQQRLQIRDWVTEYSHGELITMGTGRTYAVRWRTRERDNGLADYIGSQTLIGRMADPYFQFAKRFVESKIRRFDGNIYPVYRIAMAGLCGAILPSWIMGINLFKDAAMCSEMIANFYAVEPNDPYFYTGWKGIYPGHLEHMVKRDDNWNVVFEGILTRELLNEWGLPDYRDASGKPIKLVKGD